MSEGAQRLTEAQRREFLNRFIGQPDSKTKGESKRYGKTLRKAVPRDVLGAWQPLVGRASATDLLLSQDEARVKELVPLRHVRMSADPFAFFRGAALVMASDLSTLPTTGIEVMAAGDAHIANFGLFLSPERRTVFDLNDFDECSRGPWEWDVARLVASIEILGRTRGFSVKRRDEAVLAAARGYRERLRMFAKVGNLDVWYTHIDVDDIEEALSVKVSKKEAKEIKKALSRSKSKNNTRSTERLTECKNGHLRIVSRPPEIVPLRDMVPEVTEANLLKHEMARVVAAVLYTYRKTLSPERQRLLERYHGVDIARKVVGVGSVGTRAWIVVLQGADQDDSLVLQVKEADESVLERFCGKAPQKNHGQRVVEGQHAIQTSSDVFLGWTRLVDASGKTRDYYVRQLWDGKAHLNFDLVTAQDLTKIAYACGEVLAHAHARTGDRFAIASYLGKSDIFDRACLSFAKRYADQNEADYKEFCSRVKGEEVDEERIMLDEELARWAKSAKLPLRNHFASVRLAETELHEAGDQMRAMVGEVKEEVREKAKEAATPVEGLLNKDESLIQRIVTNHRD